MGAQGGGGTFTGGGGGAFAGVGDLAFSPLAVTPFMGLPAIPVAICWLLITEWASRPETKFLHLHFLIRFGSLISSWHALQNALARRTSSASLAMKKPTVLATILTPRGLIMILVSFATSDLHSMASMRRFSLEKQRTEAWLKVMPTKEGERTSVYISQPVPCRSFSQSSMS